MTERPQPENPHAIDIAAQLGAFAVEFDARLEVFLRPPAGVPPRLAEAMRYSALAPGKRIRPFLVVRCCELGGGTRDDAWPAAVAIECVHAFSLIHDDLPAIDNDDLRRGRATCHCRFDEATAILAGDALLARAFEVIATCGLDSDRKVRLIAELAAGTGWMGMIGGELADVLGEHESTSLDRTRFIHERKTGCLMASACRMGAIAACVDEDSVEALGRFGLHLGLAFQIADDLLDATSTSQAMGKATGKDARVGKQTYTRCCGVEASCQAARDAARECVQVLGRFGAAAADLAALASYVVDRNY
ncbi:MAG: polyprenyl synthetase family protein [Phycisphaerae bacterium]|nr:polyprenyl synthetase family protein [Phycisphaerae bacterium]